MFLQENAQSTDYIIYMFGAARGLVAKGNIYNGIYSQEWHRPTGLRRQEYNDNSIYVSMNTFMRPERTVAEVKRLNALYVDIDCYKAGRSKAEVLQSLENYYYDQVIPRPTFVIDSGRGLYLIWKIDEDRNALPRWSRVQQYLVDMCKPLGADAACTDAARILRVPGSLNEKSGTLVQVMAFSDRKYTLYQIMRDYNIQAGRKKRKDAAAYPYGQATEKMRKYAAELAAKSNTELPDFANYHKTFSYISQHRAATEKKPSSNYKTLLYGRCRDLERLFAMRRGADCKREIALFLYRLWMCECTHDYAYALEKTLSFNAALDKPFDAKYVTRATESAERKVKRGEIYRYSKSRLIAILDIQPAEMDQLDYISSKGAAQRKRERNRNAYLSMLSMQGKKTKAEAVRERRTRIAELKGQGKKTAEICETLHISRSTYNRDMAYIKAHALIDAVMDTVRRCADIVKDKAKQVQQAVEAAHESQKDKTGSLTGLVQCVKNAGEKIVSKIQPYYYGSSPKGATARTSLFYQFTLWDYLDLEPP